jgi:alanyl-tRNA synthetase
VRFVNPAAEARMLIYFSSHAAKTGDIKDVVITEVSGIAKGIRRIIAVTGHEAQDVTVDSTCSPEKKKIPA